MGNMSIQKGRYDEPYNHIMTDSVEYSGLNGRLWIDEPMSKHTSWRVGGVADRFYIPSDVEDLKIFLRKLPADEPVTWIGLGSNLLVRDGGIRGTVIATKNVMDDLETLPSGEIQAGAGTPCAKIARYAAGSGHVGAEFLVGIPGTLGGALAMNAGAFGSEIWDIIREVRTIDRRGTESTRTRSEFIVNYRSVTRPAAEWFLSAVIRLQRDKDPDDNHTIRELLARRSETQPTGQASCGSVFRNPADDNPAARLIDTCGLKGTKIGNACVSEKHANFIINTGGAAARDIEQLIHYVQQVVYERHGIMLVPEVCVIGDEEKK